MHAFMHNLFSLWRKPEGEGVLGGEEDGFLFKAAKGSRSCASSPPKIERVSVVEQMKLTMPEGKWERLYREKEEWLGTYLEKVTPYEFYRDLWPEGTFERLGEYEDGKNNGLALAIESKGKARHTIITDGLEQLEELLQEDFVITSPIGYFGRRRTGNNARYAYALAFDLDGVEMPQLRDVNHQMNKEIIPQATYIVNSGRGLHLYYILKEPAILLPTVQKTLKELKYALTKEVIWNRFTSTRKEAEVQGILQGFRMVGSPSKLGREYPVTAYRWGRGEKVSLDYLVESLPSTSKSRAKVYDLIGSLEGRRLEAAKQKWPEWYQRRIVEGKPRGRWTVKRDLYDWWLNEIQSKITVGHRFYGVMTLAIYAVKCGITEEELREDAYSLLQPYDDMSEEDINRFTVDDIEAALNIYQESYTTFPRDDISKLTGIPMTPNKRNGRKQADHIRRITVLRDSDYPEGTWRNKDGQPKKEQQVLQLRAEHPEASISELAKISGMSRTTLYKYLGKK